MSLFGQSQSTGGGLFGTGGFGGASQNTGTGQPSLFGQQPQQQQQQQPQGSSFGGGGGGVFGTGATNTSASNQPSAFGTGSGFGGNTGGSLLGQSQSQPQTGPFGAGNTGQSTGGSIFAQQQPQQQQSQPSGGIFGSGSAPSSNTGGLFGQQQQPQPSGGLFGSGNASSSNTGGLFGQQPPQQQQQQQQGSLFGGGGFGQQPQQSGGGLFGSNTGTQSNPGGLFGQQPPQQQQGSLFGGGGTGQSDSGGLFGQQQPQQQQSQPSGGLFGSGSAAPSSTGGLFGQQAPQQQQGSLFGGSNTGQGSTGGLFGQQQPQQPQGGLFGQQQQPQQQQGGLFGGASGQSNTGGGGLFGQQQPQQTGSLFGSSTTGGSSLFGQQKQPAQQSGGLFGTSTNTAPNATGSSSLFGQPQQQNPPAGSSLFGQPQKQQQQPSSLLGSSLLNQPSGTAVLGQQNDLSSSSNLLAKLPPLTAGQSGQQPRLGQEPKDSSVIGTSAHDAGVFDKLLESGEKRLKIDATAAAATTTADVDDCDLPKLHLGLSGLRALARRLSRPTSHLAGQKPRNIFASSAIPSTIRQHEFPVATPTETMSQSRPYKFDPYNLPMETRYRGRQALVTENSARAKEDFNAFLEDCITLNWDNQEKKIYNHFKHSDRLDATMPGARRMAAAASTGDNRRSVFGRTGLEKSVIGPPKSGFTTSKVFGEPAKTLTEDTLSGSRSLRRKMVNFAAKVNQLNEARLEETTYPILHGFAEVEQSSDQDVPRDLVEAYHALITVTGEENSQTTSDDLLTSHAQRRFTEDYLSDRGTPGSHRMRNAIMNGSRSFLEKRCWAEIEGLVAKHARGLKISMNASVTDKVRAYVWIRAFRRDLVPKGTELQGVNGEHCWALIFYLLRCGFVREATQFVSRDAGFRSMDHKFIVYMTAYAQNRRLPADLQQKIHGEYQQRLRNAPENTVDPFRMACYKIIGRCDLAHRRFDRISQEVEDWMWLQFVFAREESEGDTNDDPFGLDEIQQDFADIGNQLFADGAEHDYAVFFLLQILGGMYEQAVVYLGRFAPVSAVHFAIALDFYGLLRIADFWMYTDELLSYSTKDLPQINIAYLITQYTREFRMGDVEAAVNYFTLICLNSDLPGALGDGLSTVCHEALRELTLETRDYAKLLGDIKLDGSHVPGVIERRLDLVSLADPPGFLRTITLQAAAVADESVLVADAVLLYHLAGEYDKVVTVINKSLSEVVSQSLGTLPAKIQPLKPYKQSMKDGLGRQSHHYSLSLMAMDDPLVLAKNIMGLYSTDAGYYEKIQSSNLRTWKMLLRALDAKTRVEQGRWNEALDYIYALQLLPLRARGSTSAIREKAQSFSSNSPIVSKITGQLIMWSLTCIKHERERLHQIGSRQPLNDLQSDLLEQFRRMTKDLMLFAGMIKYKLPPKVFDALARTAGEIQV